VTPELMSVVGCSGEDFTSILQALGFRCERRKSPAVEATEATADLASPSDTSLVEPAPSFEEIWRPGKRKTETRRRPDHVDLKRKQAREQQRPKGQHHPAPPRPRAETKKEPPRQADSPFAVLADLRRTLAARSPERS
jgi:ATP-dependent RNA helicase SUPV3L1/SUV3